MAARLGMASLGFGFETPEELGERAEEYWRLVREECFPIGQAINPGLAVLTTFMCAETDEEAVRRSAGGPGFFAYSLGYYYNPATGGRHDPGRTNLYRQFRDLPREGQDGRSSLWAAGLLGESPPTEDEPKDEVQRALFRAARRGPAIGTADTIRRNIKRYEEHRALKIPDLGGDHNGDRVPGQLIDDLSITERLLVRWSRRVRITYLGLYDTVGAIGIDARFAAFVTWYDGIVVFVKLVRLYGKNPAIRTAERSIRVFIL